MTKNANFGTYLAIFGLEIQFLGGWTNWYPHIGEPMRHLFFIENIDWRGSNWSLGTKMCNFDQNIGIFGTEKVIYFGFTIVIFREKGILSVYPGQQLSHWTKPPKKFV